MNPRIQTADAASAARTKAKRVVIPVHHPFVATSESQRTVPVQTMPTAPVQPVRILFRGIPESGLND
jgi:hypothetical protein